MTGSLVVMSGGMDSATALYVARQDGHVQAVGFNYGQKHQKELRYAEAICADIDVPFDVVDITVLADFLSSSLTDDDWAVPDGHYAEESMKQTVVPNRNMIMTSIAAGVALSRGLEYVYVGVHAGDHHVYPDCRPRFIEALNTAVFEGTEGMAKPGHREPQIVAPFMHMGKHDIAKAGHDLGVPYHMTWSCYKGDDVHCGTCGTCTERKEAFQLAEVPDPTIYADVEYAGPCNGGVD
jgi:7-cyano-7-deazaguanine synthase